MVVSVFVNPTQFNDPADLGGIRGHWRRTPRCAKRAGLDISVCAGRWDGVSGGVSREGSRCRRRWQRSRGLRMRTGRALCWGVRGGVAAV